MLAPGLVHRSPWKLRTPLTVLAALAPLVWLMPVSGQSPPVNFNREIRPLLADNCFACHGPDEKNRKSGLRLDSAAAAAIAGESGEIALVPGQPAKSELIRRLTSAKPDERMPPAKSGKQLKPEQIELFRRWVSEGAKYENHWAFVPPVRPAPPAVRDASWPRNPLDRFVLARLEQQGLAPSPEADRITLLRRAWLDVVGLPPSPADVDAFLSDASEGAYERAIDRLLASPRYGERWGRHWLDVARYADSDGFEKDKSRQMFFYRDWVISAFNRDLPYDRFLVEQLAGDLLQGATQEQRVATGFLRNSMINEEGGIDPEQFRMDAMFDRMDALGKSVLGLTIQCGQCHSHKYDPLRQEEYYRLFAYLNNDHEAQPVVYTPAETALIGRLQSEMDRLENELKQKHADWSERMDAWEAREHEKQQPQWTVLAIENAGDNSQRYLPQGDGSLLAQGYAPTKHKARFRVVTPLQGITAFRLELLPDPNLPCGGPGRSFKGTCALSEFTVEAAPAKQEDKLVGQKVVAATSDVNPPESELEPNFFDKSKDRRVTGPVAMAIDGNDKTAWGIDVGPGRRNEHREAVFQLEKPLALGGETVLLFTLNQNHGGWNSDDHMNNNLGRFRISATTAAAKADSLPPAVRAILGIPREKRTAQQQQAVFRYWRSTVGSFKETNDKIEALWKEWPAGATSLILTKRETPRATHLLARGDWLKPTTAVSPGVPAFLHPLPQSADDSRLTLARWIADPRAPTTGRVMVNRVWQAVFGIGLVSTPEDFGVQGEPPSHPELLDYLTVELRDTHWHLKPLLRTILTSATYRQSSRITPQLAQRDPENRLLARGPRFRLEGEAVRDLALATSGLLDERIGGRSVMPPAPGFLFLPPASYAPFPWVDETGGNKYRRTVYTFRRRSTPFPMLQTFDTPNGDCACVRRSRSNSPLQALTSLNEPMFVEAAQALARAALREGGENDPQRIAYAFRRVLARPPAPEELSVLSKLYAQTLARLDDRSLSAADLSAAEKDDPQARQAAALTVVARVILNLDEAFTKE